MKKTLISLISLFTMLIFSVTAFAANPVPATDEWLSTWEERSTVSGQIYQLPGEEENDRVFCWLSEKKGNSFTYSDGTNEKSVTPTAEWHINCVLNKAELHDLPDGEYTFTYTADGNTYNGRFSVAAEEKSFTAVFCSDPQLGRSGDDTDEAVANDTYGWERTLSAAYKNGAELILSAGDQVNDGFSQKQYNALFSPDTLSYMPIAPTAGNHDFYSPLYSIYFSDAGHDAIGNDYYFSYGNALFIVLDSNNIISPMHTDTVERAIREYPDARWRVVMLHHGAYSAGADEFTNKVCAGSLKDMFDTFDIDLVLSGHNHYYSRTYPVYNGSISSSGTVYFEAGSASGGKCSSYDSVNTDYIVHNEDLKEASYSLLTFTEDTIEVRSYKTDSGELFDTFTVVNTPKAEITHFGIIARIIEFFRKILSYIPVLY